MCRHCEILEEIGQYNDRVTPKKEVSKEDPVEWGIDANLPMYTRDYLLMTSALWEDDETVMKVSESIRESLCDILGGLADEEFVVRKTSEIVGSLQNKGILFRERGK